MSSRVARIIDILDAGLSSPPVATGYGPNPIPEDAELPYVTVQEVNASPLESMEGPSGKTRTLIQVNCWAKDYEEAWEARRLITDYLHTYRDSEVVAVNFPRSHELYDGLRRLHQLIAAFWIWWEE